MSYLVDTRIAPKNSWFTPAEAKKYYGRYSREGITVHWWGGGESADRHDSIVDYFIRQGQGGIKSVNYVVSDIKVTCMVDPDNVAWCSKSGNPTTISMEHQPTLGPEGYKKSGWLVNELEKRYGRSLTLYPHSKWEPTACPGTVNIARIREEANKWKSGEYSMSVIPDQDNYYWRYGQRLSSMVRGRELSREEFRQYIVGRTDLQAVEILCDNAEADMVQNWQNVGKVATQEGWQTELGQKRAEIDRLNALAAELAKRPTQEGFIELQQGLAACQVDFSKVRLHNQELEQAQVEDEKRAGDWLQTLSELLKKFWK